MGFTLTLPETRCVHDSMNRPKKNLLLIFTVYIISQVSIVNFHLSCLVFRIILIKSDITEVSEWPKRQISVLYAMTIRDQRHTNVSKQTTLLDGVDVVHPNGAFVASMKVWTTSQMFI